MFCRLSSSSRVGRILLVSLSNIGDIVMTFPVFDALRATFPGAEISVVVGPKGKTFFCDNPHVQRVIVFDKRMPPSDKWRWLLQLRRQRFDLLVDLRNSMLPFLLGTRYSTRPVMVSVPGHMKERHMLRLISVVPHSVLPGERYAGYLSGQELRQAKGTVYGQNGFVVFAPGAADQRKRWNEDGFTKVIQHVTERLGHRVVVVGDRRDRPVVERILRDVSGGVINLCGFTTLRELSGVVRLASLVVANDSGIMHLASYFDIPIIALFGPTDPLLYGPWSSRAEVVRKGELMADIKVEDVLKALDSCLAGRQL
ncbi:MAG: glycosyltransferase family 9 protein [Candidatus Omnitrophica bacterium]|nr:glycosyltransferase family 9 protein [Candidatus Omnitrophota bacterium]